MRQVALMGCALFALSTIQACEPSTGPENHVVTVDSGAYELLELRTAYSLSYATPIHVPRISWTEDGSRLMVAGYGPTTTYPQIESSLWSVTASTKAVAKLWTLSTSVGLGAVTCYRTTTDCDLIFDSGRVLRRGVNGDTTTILPSSNRGFAVSSNGRFFVNNETGNELYRLDASTGVKTALTVSSSLPLWAEMTISDDGAEVDVVAFPTNSVNRNNIVNGTSQVWAIPAEAGWPNAYVREVRWVGSTLFILIARNTDTQVRVEQYAPDLGTHVVLGTTERKGTSGESLVWRPELERVLVNRLSACELVEVNYSKHCVAEQWELELLRGGVTTRIARNGFGFWNAAMSPDGKAVAHGSTTFLLRQLPD